MAITISPVDIAKRRSLDMRPGDTVRVTQKIIEKGKQRLQAFEGLVLAKKHGKEAGGTFTVRRAKLYFIREKVAREARRQLRRTRMMGGGIAAEEKLEAAAEEGIRAETEPVTVEVGAESKSE